LRTLSAWPKASLAPSRLSIGIFPSGSRYMYVTVAAGPVHLLARCVGYV